MELIIGLAVPARILILYIPTFYPVSCVFACDQEIIPDGGMLYHQSEAWPSFNRLWVPSGAFFGVTAPPHGSL